MIRIEEAIEIARDPDAIYGFLASVEHYPAWLPGVASAEQTSPGSVGPGTTFRLRLAGPSGPIVADGVVISAKPGRSLVVRGEAAQGRVEGGLELEPTAAGTDVRVRMQVELGGMYRFAEGLVAGELRRSMPGVLARLKQRIEDSAES